MNDTKTFIPKPRRVKMSTKVEIDKKTKESNPRKFEKHKKNITSESKFESYLESLNESEGKWFIILGKNGRHNGSALVKASSKAEAKQIGNDYWMEEGRIVKVYDATHEDVAWYLEDDEAEMKAKVEAKAKAGKPPYEEIEWGT